MGILFTSVMRLVNKRVHSGDGGRAPGHPVDGPAVQRQDVDVRRRLPAGEYEGVQRCGPYRGGHAVVLDHPMTAGPRDTRDRARAGRRSDPIHGPAPRRRHVTSTFGSSLIANLTMVADGT